MAISIIKQPQDLSPVYNPMIIAVTGSYQTSASYQFVAEIKAEGDVLTQLKIPVNPEGYGVFDIHRHVENKITFDFDPTLVGLNVATFSSASYSVSFAEEFRYEWEFFDNHFISGASIGFRGPTGGPEPLFDIGDEILVVQEVTATGPTNLQYDGDTTIVSITYSVDDYWVIGIAKPFGVNTPPEGGSIFLQNFDLLKVSSTQSVSGYAWNGVFNFLESLEYDEADYIPNTSAPYAQWLTSVPQNWAMTRDDRMFLMAYKNDGNQQKTLMVQTNNGTYSIPSVFSGIPLPYHDRFVQAAVGPYHLINATSSFTAIGSATFPMIDANTTTYSVWYRNQILQQDTETRVFKLREDCSKFENIQLIFLDKLGSFIPYTFNMVSRNNKDIQRSKYKQFYGEYAVAQNDWTYKTYNRGTTTIDTRVTERFTITSNWVNQETSNYLMELFESPEVYWINESGVTIAIDITTQNVERKQVINDQLINYTIEFELSNKDMKQKG